MGRRKTKHRQPIQVALYELVQLPKIDASEYKELDISREADFSINTSLTPDERETKINNKRLAYQEAIDRRKYIEELQQRQAQLTANKPLCGYDYSNITNINDIENSL